MQLDLFPRTELRALSDFHKLEALSLSLEERKALMMRSDFFEAPKGNEVIQRKHAEIVDKILGFRPKYIEETLISKARSVNPDGGHETWGPGIHGGVQSWVGLDLATLQTPYSELLRILRLLKIKAPQHIVDLGAAYGRMGIIIGGLFSRSSFVGYEFVNARVDEGNRVFELLKLKRCRLISTNLAAENFHVPEADVYFIYDYGQVHHIERTLRQIERMAGRRPVKVVVRGKITRQIISRSHHWLTIEYEGKLNELFTIYSARSV